MVGVIFSRLSWDELAVPQYLVCVTSTPGGYNNEGNFGAGGGYNNGGYDGFGANGGYNNGHKGRERITGTTPLGIVATVLRLLSFLVRRMRGIVYSI